MTKEKTRKYAICCVCNTKHLTKGMIICKFCKKPVCKDCLTDSSCDHCDTKNRLY